MASYNVEGRIRFSIPIKSCHQMELARQAFKGIENDDEFQEAEVGLKLLRRTRSSTAVEVDLQQSWFCEAEEDVVRRISASLAAN